MTDSMPELPPNAPVFSRIFKDLDALRKRVTALETELAASNARIIELERRTA